MALEDCSGLEVGLEDGGGAVAVRGGVGRRFKIVAVALGGGGQRKCKDGGVSASLKWRGNYYDNGISIGKDGKRGHI